MLAEIISAHRFHKDIFSGIDQIHNIRCGCCHNSRQSVKNIIIRIVYQKEKKHDRQCLEYQRTDRYIRILFQRLVQPFHTNQVKHDRGTHDKHKCRVRPEFRDGKQRDQKHCIYQHGHYQIDRKDLLRRTGQFFFIIPYLCTGTDSVSRNTKHGHHGKIIQGRCCKCNFSCSHRQNHTRCICKCNQRKDKCGCVQDRIHNKIPLN